MTFTKRIGKWGLLCKPNTDEGKWSLVQDARYIFNTREEALEVALTFTSSGNYLYNPIQLEVSCNYPDEEQPND